MAFLNQITVFPVFLSAVQPETVANRLNDRDEDLAGDEELDDDE